MVIVCGRRPMTARTGLPASRPAAILSQAGVRASRDSALTTSTAASPAAAPNVYAFRRKWEAELRRARAVLDGKERVFIIFFADKRQSLQFEARRRVPSVNFIVPRKLHSQ